MIQYVNMFCLFLFQIRGYLDLHTPSGQMLEKNAHFEADTHLAH